MGEGKGPGGRTVWLSLAGLAIGFILGILTHGSQTPALLSFAAIVGPLGKLWTNALQIIVIPLVATLLFSTLASLSAGRNVGKWGWISAATFFCLLVLGAVFATIATKVYLVAVAPPLDLAGVQDGTAKGADFTFADWVGGLMPDNFFEALAKGELLPVMILTILLALASRALRADTREQLVGFVQNVRDLILAYVHAVMLFLPFGAFALAYSFSAENGFAAAGVVFHFLVLISSLLVAFTLLLYLLAWLVGRVPLRAFATAILPAQTVAVSSRSSVASLPAMVEAAESIRLPSAAGSFVLPLAVSVFKLNRTVSSTGKVLFCAYALGIPMSPMTLITFTATVMLLSVSTPGIPSTGGNVTLGAYMAAGIPAEVALLFEPVEPILDMFKTVTNVTGNLLAATIVSRFSSMEEAPELAALGEPVPAEA